MNRETPHPSPVMSSPHRATTPGPEQMLLGDEAVALGAIHAGISAAYGYPGTPSTEILQYLVDHAAAAGCHANWAANEKTAYEQALGVSMMGRRAIVTMKHVGLNVAMDAFVNSALVDVKGGLVVAVADDPGMHSSQNEQDSRVLADFARVPVLEPATQQEAYDMAREAFDLSERHRVPVLLRLVTRLCHGRAPVRTGPARPQNPVGRPEDTKGWTLLPAYARRLWHELLLEQQALAAAAESSPRNVLALSADDRGLGVITTGIARNYYRENLPDLGHEPSHLHVGQYPFPVALVRALADRVDRILVLEEGFPFLERHLRGLLGAPVPVLGKESGEVNLEGELSPDVVRRALGLPPHVGLSYDAAPLPLRLPQLCSGCPHRDSFDSLQKALATIPGAVVTGDIGCYTLGALPPYRTLQSCVCMGASVGMAKGAADAGAKPAVGVIGDSTFLHSGVAPLMDAVAANTDMTLVILDNQAVAMTGAQQTVLPDSRLQAIVLGVGADPDHVHVVDVHPQRTEQMAELLRREIAHPGLSVIIAVRECVIAAKKDRGEGKAAPPPTASAEGTVAP